jgi:hypothetical protein
MRLCSALIKIKKTRKMQKDEESIVESTTNVQKRVVKQPVHIATYTTKGGTTIPSHVARRRKAEGGEVGEQPSKPQVDWDAVHQKRKENLAAEREKVKGTSSVESAILDNPNRVHVHEEPLPVNDRHHTSGVFSLYDQKGEHHYFKPEKSEVWEGKRKNTSDAEAKTEPFKSCIVNDRLGKREVLASQISEELRMSTIPKTEWKHITSDAATHSDLGEGSLQKDASHTLSTQGFREAQPVSSFIGNLNFTDAQAVSSSDIDGIMQLQRRSPNESKEFVSAMKSALANGGMETAFFDYIIGNTDRHSNNLYIGKNEKGEYKFAGIDHGLSFPTSTEFKENDFKNSLKGLWAHATEHGRQIDCGTTFKRSILHDRVTSRIQEHLEGSKLTTEETKGVLERIQHVKEHLGRRGTLNGADLRTLLNKNVKKGV